MPFDVAGPAGPLPANPLVFPPAEPPTALVKRAREGAPAQVVVCVRLLVNQVGDGHRDLVVDLAVLLLVELREDAVLGDEEVGVGNPVLVQVLRQAGAVLHREAAQGRTAREERLDLARYVGFEAAEHGFRQAGFELESLHESRAFDGNSPRRERYTACHENTNREIPDPTTPKPLAGKNRCRRAARSVSGFVRAAKQEKSVQRAGEGAAADELARLGML